MNTIKIPKSPKDEIIGFSLLKNIINIQPQSPRSLKNKSDIITLNPLKNFINITSKNPDWCCNHEGIEIINHQEKMFRCLICNKKGRIIKRFYQKELITALNNK
jgi:hypothetical protein